MWNTGAVAVSDAVMALVECLRSGRGQVIDAAMVDGASTLMGFFHGMAAMGGWPGERGTNILDTGAHYYDTYETADGRYVSIGSIEPQFYAELLRLTEIEFYYHGPGHLDNFTHRDPIKTGSLYPNGEFGMDKYRKENCVMNKAGHGPDEFFTQEVIANGNHIQIIVNGKKTLDWKDPDNTFASGHFALQGHEHGCGLVAGGEAMWGRVEAMCRSPAICGRL